MTDGRRYPARPIVCVGGVIVDAAAEHAVLVQRGQPPLLGEWSIPGGVVEVGETLEEAVAREVHEETGLTVTVGPVVEVLERIHRDADGQVEYHYVIVDYLCRPTGGSLVSASDAAAAHWVREADVANYQPTQKVLDVAAKAFTAARSGPASRRTPAPPAAR